MLQSPQHFRPGVQAWGTLLLGLLLPLPVLSQQHDLQHRYAVEQLREDFRVFRLSLEEGHGGLYQYSSKNSIDRLFDDAESRIDTSMTELEFLRLLSAIIAGVNDGHTEVRPSEGLAAYLEQQRYFPPFELIFIDGRGYFHQDYTADGNLPIGAELTHIDGVSLSDATARLLSTMPSDGHVETSKWRWLESPTDFVNAYVVSFGISTRFDVAYRTRDGREHRRMVDGVTQSQLLDRYQTRYLDAARDLPPIELAYVEGIPVLTVRTFRSRRYQRAGIDYPQFLKDAFADLSARDARHLIIDVRENSGGSDETGRLLAAHLLDREFLYYESLIMNRNEFEFLEYASLSNDDIPRDRLRRRDDGRFDLLGHSNLGPQQPATPVFRGDVYILISGESFSGTGEFTSVVHHHRRATFIGEEGGAGYYGNTSGIGTTVTLPNSKIRVVIPMVRYVMAVSGYEPIDRGLIPDHQVQRTLDDVLSGRDTILEYAIGLILTQER